MQLTRKGFLAGVSAMTLFPGFRLWADEKPFGAGARVLDGDSATDA